MRLIVHHGPHTVIVVLDDGATISDLEASCVDKLGVKNDEFYDCLDVAGRPVLKEMKEMRDGDHLCLVSKEEGGAPPKRQRTTSTCSERSVRSQIRDDTGYVRAFAGHEDGNAIVRCVLAALGNITDFELSVPTNDVYDAERTARANIVQSSVQLSEGWKNMGSYYANEAGDFLRAVAVFYKTSVVVVDLVNAMYVHAHRYQVDGSDGVVSLDVLADQMSGSIVLERKGTHFSTFLYLKRPASKDEAYSMHASGFGICYDRSKYTKAAKDAGILTKRTRFLPCDCEYVAVIFAHMNLNGIVRQTLNLLDLTFREECESLEQRGDIAPQSCIPFEDKNVEAQGLFVRKDILHLRNSWAEKMRPGSDGVSPLDARRDLRSANGMLEI